jgi:RsiW-degrading membrane proteinase PrsW (M82 family)
MLAGALAVATVAFGLTPNEHKAMWMFYLIALGLAGEIGWLFKRLLS